MSVHVYECVCCHDKATMADFRELNGTTSKYPVCDRHFQVDDEQFWDDFDSKYADILIE